MSKRIPYTQQNTFIGRLPHNSDVLGHITKLLNEEKIKVGEVKLYGFLQNLVLSEFNFETKFTDQKEVENAHGLVEICSLSGVVSMFKGRASVNLSGVFKLQSGNIVCGSVGLGTRSYACEAIITVFDGATLSRDFDSETSLPLWKNAEL